MQDIPGNIKLLRPKHGNTTGGSGRGGAQRGSGAARGSIGRDAIGTILQEDNPRSDPPAHQELSFERLFGSTTSLNSYSKPTEEPNNWLTSVDKWLTTGLSPVYQGD